MNDEAREDGRHSTRQGLSNNSTRHDLEWVLVFTPKCISNPGQLGISSHDQNGWADNWLTRARMIILMTLSVLADHFPYSSIHKF